MARLFVLLQYVLPHHGLSRLVAVLANCRWPIIKGPFIRLFAKRYGVDLAEAKIQDYRQYRTFNEFFTRELKDGARPIDGLAHTLVSPADGAISELGPIQGEALLQAKGMHYSVSDLLGSDRDDAQAFLDGSFLTVYLSPRDYHRVHMPLAGSLLKTVYVPGRLFSVNDKTAARVPGLFARNERLVCHYQTAAGPMALVMVGAMIVAGIETVWAGQVCPTRQGLQRTDYRENTPPIQLAKGSEMGRFLLGSTVILLFGPGAVTLHHELRAGDPIRLGDAIGVLGNQATR
jgi:phosphatidylserine decarboxylase